MGDKFYKSNRCIHYNGTAHKTCMAGVEYRSVAKPGGGLLVSVLPCFAESGISEFCTKCEYPTAEQVVEGEKWLDEHLDKMFTARKAITNHLEKNKALRRNVSGVIDCPHCGGKLSFSYAGAYNRHIHATCENKCVEWIE